MPVYREAFRIFRCSSCRGIGWSTWMDEPDEPKTKVCWRCQGTGIVLKAFYGSDVRLWDSMILTKAKIGKKAKVNPELFKFQMTRYRYYKLKKQYKR